MCLSLCPLAPLEGTQFLQEVTYANYCGFSGCAPFSMGSPGRTLYFPTGTLIEVAFDSDKVAVLFLDREGLPMSVTCSVPNLVIKEAGSKGQGSCCEGWARSALLRASPAFDIRITKSQATTQVSAWPAWSRSGDSRGASSTCPGLGDSSRLFASTAKAPLGAGQGALPRIWMSAA